MKKTSKVILKILQWLVLIVLALILVLNIIVSIKRLANKKEEPTLFGYSTSVVLSDSMNPTFYKSDLIIVKKKSNYEVGDVIKFVDPILGYVTHRIIEVTENGFITQGDNTETNNTADPEILKKDVKGKVVGVVPRVGYFIDYLKSTVGLILMCVLFIGLIVLNIFLAKRGKTKKNETKIN